MTYIIFIFAELILLLISAISYIIGIKYKKMGLRCLSMISNLLVISICLDLMIQFNHVNIYQFIVIVMTTYSVVVQIDRKSVV